MQFRVILRDTSRIKIFLPKRFAHKTLFCDFSLLKYVPFVVVAEESLDTFLLVSTRTLPDAELPIPILTHDKCDVGSHDKMNHTCIHQTLISLCIEARCFRFSLPSLFPLNNHHPQISALPQTFKIMSSPSNCLKPFSLNLVCEFLLSSCKLQKWDLKKS